MAHGASLSSYAARGGRSTAKPCSAIGARWTRSHLPWPNLSKRRQQEQIYPYLLRSLTIARPNQVWGIEITYVRLQQGWMYLVAILDWYARYVGSPELDQSLELPFVLAAVERALACASPVIVNSDQGSHFTSPQYRDLLQAADVQISMDGKG